jgi:hypothetical protein
MEHPFRHFFSRGLPRAAHELMLADVVRRAISTSFARLSWLRPNVLQYLFAEHIGISFTGLGKSNDLVGDGLPDIVGAVSSPQGDADLFERYTQDTQRFLIDLFTV